MNQMNDWNLWGSSQDLLAICMSFSQIGNGAIRQDSKKFLVQKQDRWGRNRLGY